MAKIIGLPKLSPTMEEGTLASWVKAEGDSVDIDDLLAEVETDKATMEFRSFDKGVLLKILAAEGDTLAPDQPVAIIGKAGEDISALLAQVESGGGAPAPAPAEAPAAAPAAPAAPKPAKGDAKVIGLPKLSPTMEEGTLAAWSKAEGDAVDIDDLLAEVETDKATMEFRSFDKGVLLKILAPEGTVLKPDQPVAIIGKAGTDVSGLLAELESGGGAAPAAAPAPDAAPAATAPAPAAAPMARPSGGRVLASPLVRRIAREEGLDLGAVAGSGPGGRIIKRDLEGAPKAAAAPAAAAPAAAPVVFGERRPPVVEKASQMRKTIARRLTESKQTVPHYYLTIDVDAAPIMAARKQVNAVLEARGEKVSVNDFIIKAVAAALREVPDVNASWVDGTIVKHQVVDISVAVAIPDGLMTPVVRDADLKGLAAIHSDVVDLATRAKAKKLKPEEYTGGTFSISNLGMFGIDEFSAVINPPEGAILAVGATRDEPVVMGDKVVPGKRMKMTLSCDHRVIDGALGATFLKALRGYLEAPISLIA